MPFLQESGRWLWTSGCLSSPLTSRGRRPCAPADVRGAVVHGSIPPFLGRPSTTSSSTLVIFYMHVWKTLLSQTALLANEVPKVSSSLPGSRLRSVVVDSDMLNMFSSGPRTETVVCHCLEYYCQWQPHRYEREKSSPYLCSYSPAKPTMAPSISPSLSFLLPPSIRHAKPINIALKGISGYHSADVWPKISWTSSGPTSFVPKESVCQTQYHL